MLELLPPTRIKDLDKKIIPQNKYVQGVQGHCWFFGCIFSLPFIFSQDTFDFIILAAILAMVTRYCWKFQFAANEHCGGRFVFLRFVKCLRAVQLVSFLVSLFKLMCLGNPVGDLRRITVPRKVSFSSETEHSGSFWKLREKGIKIKRWTYAHINESMKSVILPQTLCDSHGISGCGMERESKWTEEARCSRCTGEIRCWSMSERRFLAFTHPHKSCPFNWIIFSSKCSPPTPSNLRGASDCKSIPNQK